MQCLAYTMHLSMISLLLSYEEHEKGRSSLRPQEAGKCEPNELELGNECSGLKELLQKMHRALPKYKFQINKDFLAERCLLRTSTLAAQALHHVSTFPSQQLEQISLPAPCAIPTSWSRLTHKWL